MAGKEDGTAMNSGSHHSHSGAGKRRGAARRMGSGVRGRSSNNSNGSGHSRGSAGPRRTNTSPNPPTSRPAPPGSAAYHRSHSDTVNTPSNSNTPGSSVSEESDPFDLSTVTSHTLLSNSSAHSRRSHHTHGSNSDDVFQDEPITSTTTTPRFSTSRLGYSTARHSDVSVSSQSLGSTMLADRAGRDLRQVDQSVNIMAGQYGSGTGEENDFTKENGRSSLASTSTTSSRASRRRQTKRASYLEILFDSGSTRVNRKSMMAIDLGPDPTKKPRKSIFQSFTSDSGMVQEPLSMKIQDCCERFCECFYKIFCSIWFWGTALAIVVTCVLVFIVPHNGGDDTGNVTEKTTNAPTNAQVATTPSPTAAITSLTAPPSQIQVVEEPTTVEGRMQALQTKLFDAVPTRQEDFNDPSSKSSLALAWLAEFDPLKLSILDTPMDDLVERYALATFFFSTNDSLDPQDISITEPAVTNVQLRRQRRQQRGLQQDQQEMGLQPWMSSAPVCEWEGMRCENGRLVELNRTKAGLTGTLPREMMALTSLVELDLSHNLFQGSIPTEGGLPNLRFLLLHDNGKLLGVCMHAFKRRDQNVRSRANLSLCTTSRAEMNAALTGSLPESIGNMSALYDIDLSSNQLEGKLPKLDKLSNLRLFLMDQNIFTGTISPTVRKLEHLEYLYLADNKLDGELPFEIFSHLKRLVDLRLENNALTGSIPPEVGGLHRLEFIKMGKNALGGSLPDVFDRFHYLVEFDLHRNGFQGSLPTTLATLTTLERLNLAENAFTGAIPSGWADLPELSSMMLHHNHLVGPIPSGNGLRKLQDLWLNNNTLTGSIPEGFGDLTSLVDIFLENNELDGSLPESLGNLNELAVLKAFHTQLTGTVPLSICALRTTNKLKYLATDCVNQVVCRCCDKCL
ncbi:LRR receptor-like serine threonine-protein kinase At4g08850-like [Seminavis robusta]|uniref:LRR receptor-like serine threonine-protein kinase At4g08850-like n=1 Tax=Seminavis robusta TaxID=568900 RepID=A0A9N8DB50_9STRA|nr:LRR receptor-like serine threonine-protein kinase At4g08850-like [Seminavis robusta]|eukprot:Sro41_g025350.1 LRR receptor-like serine threonine-protein kinase At4g08850-like (907) ;mRNA; f:139896-143174